MGSARDAILEALENLTADELKKFKLKLLSVPLREGYGRIPRGPLLAMDAMDLTDKIVSSYLETYGAELTATVLAQMGMQEQAEQLKELSRKGLHFIDEHRAALISRVTEVAGVLDALYGKVLNDEQYQAVQAECTNPLKMRKLYSYTPAWNQACKDLFLQALRATQPFLVADLEQS
ncbi:PREDICTED: apoptosis-associated speck-like protein containing a CARD isoform X2 [Elephantulus edwardii]|uniref:apoptosis-associated speck-like protein containing a CARD isoform X2 n=1 Tax=Elephantulus edwardii TaxID=28737 RepID=UPI0003F09876|nr:PREDICTED: apoptosis-associated speck-like protein containing a CARD isoform X2 [Elephantulus edwardii]